VCGCDFVGYDAVYLCIFTEVVELTDCYFHLLFLCSRVQISNNVKKVLLVWEVSVPIVFVVTV